MCPIKAFRQKHKLTQTQLAELLGRKRRAIQYWESNKCPKFASALLEQLNRQLIAAHETFD